MSHVDVEAILDQVEDLLAKAGELPDEAALAVEKLLNVVEALSADTQELTKEVERLRQQLEQKKKPKTTSDSSRDDSHKSGNRSDHSSEDRRRQRRKKARRRDDRRSFKALTIHEEVECPIDLSMLPPDAVQVGDEFVVVQDIQVKPHNIRFQRRVFHSAMSGEWYRSPLPQGYDRGDFGADLRALILSLKYCGNMSEPKIREFLDNFDVQISVGSLSNILTRTAAGFEEEYDSVLIAGLSSTQYQQTDDTSARVAGQSWHTHVVCNPYYTWYATRPGKDRLTVLAVLQNQEQTRFRFSELTLRLLREEFAIPEKWLQRVAGFVEQHSGDVELDAAATKPMLDDWFAGRCQQTRTAIEHAAAIVSYRQQSRVPVIPVLVCDDAGQFKLLTDDLALCWIHQGRHYERLSPVVPRHVKSLDGFLDRYWDYYAALQDYRASPSEAWAKRLRETFDELFATTTGYAALDERIGKTAEKKAELLTVLSHPTVPLHNNASELGARVSARRRDVSLHSRSARGAHAMDIFTTLVQTCKKLTLSAYAYFRAHLRAQPFTLAPRILQAAAST